MVQSIGLPEREVFITFGSRYAPMGEALARDKKVSQARLDMKLLLLTGEVQDTQPRPFKVRITLNRSCSKIISTGCSCELGGICKHSAALCFHSIKEGIIPRGEIADGPQSPRAASAPGPMSQNQTGGRPMLSPNVQRWVTALGQSIAEDEKASGAAASDASRAAKEQTDFVLYMLKDSEGRLLLECVRAKKLKTGEWGSLQTAEVARIAQKGAFYITDEDADICTLFERARGDTTWTYRDRFPAMNEICAVLLERMIATGRCFWKSLENPMREIGGPKKAQLRWELLGDGSQILRFYAGNPDYKTILAGGVWYLNIGQGIIGPLVTDLPAEAVKHILHSPRVEQKEAIILSEALRKLGTKIPGPVAKFTTTEETLKPTPRLSLKSLPRPQRLGGAAAAGIDADKQTEVTLSFDYGGVRFDSSDNTESRTISGDQIIVQRRDVEAEKAYTAQVEALNLGERLPEAGTRGAIVFRSFQDNPSTWLRFVESGMPKLQAQGFAVDMDKSFDYDIVIPEEEWEADASEGTDFWFSLDLGIRINGQKVALLPIIHQAIRRMVGENPLAEIEQLNVNGKFFAPLPDGRFVALPFERVRAVVLVLLEMFDRDAALIAPKAKISLPELMELSKALSGGAESGWKIGTKLSALLENIKGFEGLKTITPPAELKATLRPYQLDGLSWLDFIRQFELGGILADDMGLGKTVQTLAHIAVEKKEKRVDKPYLVVCPTSVLPNWVSEIHKFAPDFKVLPLTGSDRSADFGKIAGADIVVSTYPLVPRDIDHLSRHHWQAVILDEAQYIKNPQTQVAQAVGKLRAVYRLCLSGTPIENHLGELWSQFNFLMPGFLRDLPTFNRTIRNPIEKHKDLMLQKHLAAKVRPFLLRRTKELVADDLPEKTIITRTVELEGAQRDLYETVRLAMYEKVQDALAVKGLAKSQIVILDALLKLRQVCCDPRLVKLSSARDVTTSAKLDQLLEMIEELLAEGKRILLFSQFTSMLDLIEPELTARQIDFAQIRGDTKDRATPVKMFQEGKVPLFLLSLKAGGTGLNLTAADTVIHYDPWWNPAVENQATDRAHRIGQNKAVFVFKLIAAGTIEERMVELQEKKRAIAEAIYGDEAGIASKLTAEDLESLFLPLT